MVEMAKYKGKCPVCGRINHSNRKGDIIVCDCWNLCPLCGANMTPYTPDLAPKTYGVDGKRELSVLMACSLHSPPFYSKQKPVEVVCDEEVA
jgi:hypothetical protein